MNNGLNILVVDDDQDIADMLKMMLQFKGYNVTVVNRADNINPTLTANSFQLIILDMLIGSDSGLDVCRALKADERFAPIPILMFSAMPDGGKLAVAAGADDFIAKPFTMHVILEKINRQLLPV
jgi:DNA-binding response OmpR family regulator